MIRTETSGTWNGSAVKVLGRNAAKRSAFEIGLIVEGQAKLLSPVDTGRLAGSITTQARDKGTNPEAPAQGGDRIQAPQDDMEVLVGTAVSYGPYIEFGTVRSKAQPFLRPSLDLARGKGLTVALSVARNEFQDYL